MNQKRPGYCVQRAVIYYLLITVCAIFAFSLSARSEVYKWVDENGIVHFSDSPPAGKKAKKLNERPVDKFGGAEPVSPSEPEGGGSENSNLEDRIQYYEEEISKDEQNIDDYENKIEEFENSKRNIPSTHRMGPSQEKYYADLKKQLDSDIERYRGLINDTRKKIDEYRGKIAGLENELAVSRLKEPAAPEEQKSPGQKPPEQKPTKAILYHGDVAINIFHQPGCNYYDCENCVAIFDTREAALSAGYKPCNICNP